MLAFESQDKGRGSPRNPGLYGVLTFLRYLPDYGT